LAEKKKVAKKTTKKSAVKKTTKSAVKKTTKSAVKKTTKSAVKKTTKKSKKSKNPEPSDTGIIIVDDDLTINKEAEMEERRAYLEEARSQEAASD